MTGQQNTRAKFDVSHLEARIVDCRPSLVFVLRPLPPASVVYTLEHGPRVDSPAGGGGRLRYWLPPIDLLPLRGPRGTFSRAQDVVVVVKAQERHSRNIDFVPQQSKTQE